jgi:hypothetical protein
MTIAVPFFGQDPRWLALLGKWWACYEATQAAKHGVHAVIITDEAGPAGYPVVRVTPEAIGDLSHPWDRKGAVIVAALPHLGPVLVCDVDAFLQRNPVRYLEDLAQRDILMATQPDGWKRPVCGAVVQRQAGVMWFSQRAGATIPEYYRRAHAQVSREHPGDDWREQMAWSLVAYWTGIHELPKTLNTSHHDREAAAAVIVHEHGETKWRRLSPPIPVSTP